jgi:SAM-dependent methyltransferase
LNDLAANAALRAPEFHISDSAKKTAYPIRAFRYWWVAQAISRELAGRQHTTIVDLGSEAGQMRRFYSSAPSRNVASSPDGQSWIALDLKLNEGLAGAGYSEIVACDFDAPLPLATGSVDALICIHVMEHLPRPAFTMSEIARVLAPGGLFWGGSPTAPKVVSYFIHRTLQRMKREGTTGPNGHINSLSPGDWKRLVRGADLEIDFVSGSHFMRRSGSSIEDSKNWAKLNLFWGGMFPSLGSEVYLQAHKPRCE